MADNKQRLDELWYDILRRAKDFAPEPVSEETHWRGAHGEEHVLERERERVRQSVNQMDSQMRRRICRELEVSDPVEYVRKVTPYEANHDIRTLRFSNGNPTKHYVHWVKHWVEVKTTARGAFQGTMSRKQSDFAVKHPDTTSLVVITGERKDDDISHVQEFSSLEDRIPFLHREVRRDLGFGREYTGA
ncbi:MAG: hypothetical protein ACE5JQ_14775 [Candidatus Methylomirabilales bacterium]